jgi:hypothetical protein
MSAGTDAPRDNERDETPLERLAAVVVGGLWFALPLSRRREIK